MKNIFFLAGLPRSGNTLLSALLNQNPKVYVSPLSPLLNNIQTVDRLLNINEESLSCDFSFNTTQGLQEYVKGFYKHINKPFVIDRNKTWGSKESLYMAYKYITEKPQIIYTVRDIPSILRSFLSLIKNNDENFIDNNLRSLTIRPYGNQTLDDVRCDWLMNNQIGSCLVTLTELLQTGTKVYLVEYDNLILNTQQELGNIYEFLGLENYLHNLNNITKIETETLDAAGLPTNLHDVRNTIQRTENSVSLELPEITKNKYTNLEFWRNK